MARRIQGITSPLSQINPLKVYEESHLDDSVDTEAATFISNLDNETHPQKFVNSIALQGTAEMKVGSPIIQAMTSQRNAPRRTQ